MVVTMETEQSTEVSNVFESSIEVNDNFEFKNVYPSSDEFLLNKIQLQSEYIKIVLSRPSDSVFQNPIVETVLKCTYQDEVEEGEFDNAPKDHLDHGAS